MTMKHYANSAIYPVNKAAIQAIAENMRQNGYDDNFPILVKGDEIVDGFHRSEAARIAGVQPVYSEVPNDWTDKDILRYVLRANGDRRHLNDGQRASITILIKRRLGDAAPSVDDLAAQAGVTKTTINRFITMDANILEDVASGKTTQEEAKQQQTSKKGSRGGNTKTPTYTLNQKQVRQVASLGVVVDKPAKKIMAEAMDIGFAELEKQYANAGN